MIQVGIYVTYFGPLRQMIYSIILGFAQLFLKWERGKWQIGVA